MNETTSQVGSGHNQRRFRHHNLTDAVKHGASINSIFCQPWACVTTPQAGHPNPRSSQKNPKASSLQIVLFALPRTVLLQAL